MHNFADVLQAIVFSVTACLGLLETVRVWRSGMAREIRNRRMAANVGAAVACGMFSAYLLGAGNRALLIAWAALLIGAAALISSYLTNGKREACDNEEDRPKLNSDN